eukprot:1141678-Pelagomonas_calceolata.AAC.4
MVDTKAGVLVRQALAPVRRAGVQACSNRLSGSTVTLVATIIVCAGLGYGDGKHCKWELVAATSVCAGCEYGNSRMCAQGVNMEVAECVRRVGMWRWPRQIRQIWHQNSKGKKMPWQPPLCA